MPTQGYFFIVGYPRSGTTLLSVLLDRHSRLCVPPETAFFDEVAPSLIFRSNAVLMRVLSNWKRLAELNLELETVRQRLRKRHCSAGEVLAAILDLYALSRGKVRCGEKTPYHLRHVPKILRYFPDAKVICILRDGREAALSLNSMPWWGQRGLAAAARLWKRNVRLMEGFNRKYPSKFMLLRYEDLVVRPEQTLSGVMDYLEEEFEPAQLRSDTPSYVVLPRSREWKGKALEPIDEGCIAHRRSRARAEDLAFLERTMRDELRRYGYCIRGLNILES
jgi:hypothetical protein